MGAGDVTVREEGGVGLVAVEVDVHDRGVGFGDEGLEEGFRAEDVVFTVPEVDVEAVEDAVLGLMLDNPLREEVRGGEPEGR